jgi:hypothetical protein
MISSSGFRVLGITFKSLIYVCVIFVQSESWGSSVSLLMWIFTFLSTIYSRGCDFFNVCFWHLCHKSVRYRYVGLFIVSVFCYIVLCICFYVKIIQFGFHWLCHMYWDQVFWCLLFCPFCSILFGYSWCFIFSLQFQDCFF